MWNSSFWPLYGRAFEVNRLLLFKGYCRWGRQQLAAEFADGKWGACAAEPADVLNTPCAELWAQLRASGRLEHAPVLDMSRFR